MGGMSRSGRRIFWGSRGVGPEVYRAGGLSARRIGGGGEGGIGTGAEDGESAGGVHRQWGKGYVELGVIIEHF